MVFEVNEPAQAYRSDTVVLDNSVSMRWLVASRKRQDQQYALTVRERIRSEDLRVMVPYLWVYEAAHVVAGYVDRGDLNPQASGDALMAFQEYFTILIGRESAAELSEFSRTHKLSAYDAAYLMLAKTLSAPLATLDKQMRKVAKKLGVALFATGY